VNIWNPAQIAGAQKHIAEVDESGACLRKVVSGKTGNASNFSGQAYFDAPDAEQRIFSYDSAF
jgi:hypothetical protein